MSEPRPGYLLPHRATVAAIGGGLVGMLLRTFSAAAATSFAVGVGMFGAIMFVPLFAQGVLGESATNAGLVLTPLMLALVAASAGSGQVISRTGHYRWAIVSGPLGAATSAGQFFRTTGGTIGVTVMGAVMTAGLPAGVSLAGAGSAAGGAAVAPQQLADTIHPVFMLGLPVMAIALALVLLIPETPLRRTVREAEPPAAPA